MKYAILLVLISSLAMAQAPSKYHVVRVVGKVESPSLKRALKTGDVIQPKDELKFDTKESYVIVNSPQTGRTRISGVPDSSPREILQLLQSFVQPELKSTSTRAIALRYLEALQNSMAYDTLLILGNGFVPVKTENLPLTKPAIIRASHQDGPKGGSKKLISKTISNDKGFTLSHAMYDKKHANEFKDGKTTTPKVIVEYLEKEDGDVMFSEGVILGSFVPMWVADEKQLGEELKALIAALPQNTEKYKVLLEIKNYLNEVYAPAQDDNLKAWLKSEGIFSE